jgi:hypothetical protein
MATAEHRPEPIIDTISYFSCLDDILLGGEIDKLISAEALIPVFKRTRSRLTAFKSLMGLKDVSF